MKKIYLFIALVIVSYSLFCQDYFKFPTCGAEWYFRVANCCMGEYNFFGKNSLGDTVIIDGKIYIEAYLEKKYTLYLEGGIREDTIEKKVYFNNFQNEILLYDFSLEIGDSIYYPMSYFGDAYHKIVQDIDSIIINGEYRRRWHLVNYPFPMPDIWIEGIGSVYREGLFYPLFPDITTCGCRTYFGCFKHNSLTYINDSVCIGGCPCSKWIIAATEIDFQKLTKNISIYPNPAKHNFIVKTQLFQDSNSEVAIYDMTGKLIKTKSLNSLKTEIDTKGWSKGIYNCVIYVNSTIASCKKIILQ